MSQTSSDFEALPDFLRGLEDRLRAAAVPAVPRRTLGRRWRRPVLAVPVASAAAIALAVIVGPFGGSTVPAYGKPAILQTPATAIPAPLRGGLAHEIAIGSGAALDEARAIPAFGDVAYLLSGGDAWCLSAPDPAANRQDVERGASCTHTDEFLRIGVALIVGDHYLAAVPRGVPDPTLTGADGRRETLSPNEQGVVAATLAAGDEVTRYDVDGARRTDRRR